MALERSVLMDDGVVRRYHKIFNLQHILNQATYIEVVSYQFGEDDNSTGVHTTIQHPFDDEMSFSEAYDYISGLPMFTEYTSDAEAQITELHEQLTEATAEIASKTDEINSMQVTIDDKNHVIAAVSMILTDEQAIEVPAVYPEWDSDGYYYSIGVRVQYNDNLYKCLQDHTSQPNWNPADAVSLWTALRSSEIDPDTPQEWVQPDSTNPYMIGDEVLHDGITWRSIIDNNVWEPGVYGWDMFVTE